MRRLLTFASDGQTLCATLDEAPGATGLLIVTGGSELRIGAHRGMAMLAADIAAAGHPVFRFDRAGVGDSTGTDRGYDASGPDIHAAVHAFRVAAPQVRRIVAFGNCDAASALALYHRGSGIDRLLLANPWVIEQAADMPPAAAIRARYARKLLSPREWLRLARGGVDVAKLVAGIRGAMPSSRDTSALANRIAIALRTSVPAAILLARRDNTAIAFAAAWRGRDFRPVRGAIPIVQCDTASHSFARPADQEWLRQRVLDTLTG